MVYVLSNPGDHTMLLLQYLKPVSDAKPWAEVDHYARDHPSNHTFRLLDHLKDSNDTTLRAEQERYIRDDLYALLCS